MSTPAGRAIRSSRSHDIAWLEFEKPDLDRAEAFAHAFGFATVLRTPDELQLRGTDAGAPCVHRCGAAPGRGSSGPPSRPQDEVDVLRLADATGAHRANRCPNPSAASSVDLVDPSGMPVRVVAGTHDLPALPIQPPHVFNVGHELLRTNATQRPPACRQAFNGSDTSCCRPPGTPRR